jgi:hypothetical protein
LSPENNTSTFTESGPRKEKKKPSKQQAALSIFKENYTPSVLERPSFSLPEKQL